jgi:hypothetical protein
VMNPRTHGLGEWDANLYHREVLAIFSPGCLHFFKVFYSEVQADKFPREQSHTVPLSQDTPVTVSTSLLAPWALDTSGGSRQISKLVCVLPYMQ